MSLAAALVAQALLAAPQSFRPVEVPAGRPPREALTRVEPRIYEVEYAINILATSTVKGDAAPLKLVQDRILMPLAILDAYSQVDPRTVTGVAIVDGTPQRGVLPQLLAAPGGITNAMLDLGPAGCSSIVATFRWQEQAWSSVLDEKLASETTWPTRWRDDAQPWLAAGPWIESENPRFTQFVGQVSGGSLRMVSPHRAAKELVLAAVSTVKSVRSDGTARTSGRMLRGVNLKGALACATSGDGTSADLACLCVAVLRAAGIPARVTVGVAEPRNEPATLVTWCEYFLPGSGWVPFLPEDIRSRASGLKVDQPWKNWGTVEDLNRLVPICHDFSPPGVKPLEYPAVWGWDAAGNVSSAAISDFVSIKVTSRGRGR